MSRGIFFDPEARLELENAILWYNDQKPGLGFEFEIAVYDLCRVIAQNPHRFRLVSNTVRIARLKRFSRFAVYFDVGTDSIGVVAVFHSKRNPDQLSRRLG